MTTTSDDGAVLGSGFVPGRAPGTALVVHDLVAECYTPGSRAALDRSKLRSIVIHCTGLSRAGDDNPSPIADDVLDGPMLAGRFTSTEALGTGKCIPYHGLTTWAGVNEQMLPLSIRGAHAGKDYNPCTWAWAIVGEHRPASIEQLGALADACALLVVLGGGLEIVGHTDLAGATEHPEKTCPRPTVDIAHLRMLVRDRMPSNWQLWPKEQREDYAVSAGLRL